jgi:hypothetical protein
MKVDLNDSSLQAASKLCSLSLWDQRHHTGDLLVIYMTFFR